MTEVFTNAPLVELVVDVRWELPEGSSPAVDNGFEDDDDVEYEGPLPFFTTISKLLGARGFTLSERMVPTGYPTNPTTPIFKFSNPDDLDTSVVYQVSQTAMSINAIPPYKTWEYFREAVTSGLEALFEALGDLDGVVFRRIDLNYVDAFNEDFSHENTRYRFLTEALGFRFVVPEAISAHMDGEQPSSAFFQFGGKLRSGDTIQVRTGVATFLNSPAVILDTKISHREKVAPSVDAILGVLDRSQTVIHDSFVQMTQPFVEIMRGRS